MTRLHVLALPVFVISVSCLAPGQTDIPGSCTGVVRYNQQVRVPSLPSLAAPSTDSSAVLATEAEIVLHDKAVCCGRDSALEDAMLAEPASLKELGAKLRGRHRLSDGQPIVVSADYVPEGSIGPGLIISALRDQHAPLIEWRSHLYVLYGAAFNDSCSSEGVRDFTILKLLLLDPRFSDQRREVVFNRETDDWGKIQGFLTLTVLRQ